MTGINLMAELRQIPVALNRLTITSVPVNPPAAIAAFTKILSVTKCPLDKGQEESFPART
jgi:hypothetical protein